MSATVHIGTSGYIYKHWADTFYGGVPVKRWLEHYAEHFETVELNGTFYRKPTPDSVRAMQTRVPEEFVFAVKMWRAVSHYRRLTRPRELLRKFMPLINNFRPDHRGPLLVQCPERMNADAARLDSFLGALSRWKSGGGWKVAMEFRNKTWESPEIFRVLNRHDAALCLADMEGREFTRANDASWIYVRRHGGDYSGNYTPAQLAADARQFAAWARGGREVWVYYNNDVGTHAVYNAMELRRLLKQTS